MREFSLHEFGQASEVLLSEGASTYGRTTEDVTDGKWTKTEWTITRRYCKKCCKQHSAVVPGVLSKEYFGTTVMSQVFCIRCLGIPFDKIQRIIHMLYGRFIETSNLIHICNTVADQCGPLYKELLKLINKAEILWGDDTAWFFNKAHWYVWAFISEHTVLYHLSASRSKTVAEAILEGFNGIIIGDSHPAWNDIGSEIQRCLLHYFKDMYQTLKDNNSAEFTSLFNRLHAILKSAINSGIKYASKNSEVPQSVITKLQSRTDELSNHTQMQTVSDTQSASDASACSYAHS